MRKFFLLITVFGIALVLAQGPLALAQVPGGDASERLAKLSARLKQLDVNNNGMIEADEASTGVGKVLIDRYFPNGPPQFPIAVSEVMRVAEVQIRGGTAGPAAPASGATAPAPASGPTQPQAGAPAPAPQPTSGGSSGTAATGPNPAPPSSAPTSPAAAASPTGPASVRPSGSSLPPAPPASSGSSSGVRSAARSYKALSVKERLQSKGLPDWFLKKMDGSGQIMMANFTDKWTDEQVKAFEKYDLNHDGIITADEVLKVQRHPGGK